MGKEIEWKPYYSTSLLMSLKRSRSETDISEAVEVQFKHPKAQVDQDVATARSSKVPSSDQNQSPPSVETKLQELQNEIAELKESVCTIATGSNRVLTQFLQNAQWERTLKDREHVHRTEMECANCEIAVLSECTDTPQLDIPETSSEVPIQDLLNRVVQLNQLMISFLRRSKIRRSHHETAIRRLALPQ